MSISVFDLFSIGIGPSSSHTVGPMRAAKTFIDSLFLEDVAKVQVHLYGSLALTGKGHGTDMAVIMGLQGEQPETIDPDSVPLKLQAIRDGHRLALNHTHTIAFDLEQDVVFHYEEVLSQHANGMRFFAFNHTGKTLASQTSFSVGGGFVVAEGEMDRAHPTDDTAHIIPYPYDTGAELLAHCKKTGKTIPEIVRDNERTWRSDAEIDQGMWAIWQAMDASIERGCQHTGILPGGLKVKRRAAEAFIKMQQKAQQGDAPDIMSWLSIYALAVNEENAAGGRVITAPTNGSAGVIPAVLKYYMTFCHGTRQGVIDFLMVAGAMGSLFKKGASISAAEMGCQGEVGVACAMAAAGLCAVWGGTPAQIENATEIGMEHHLGLTCDPIAGLVQVPCIERNTMGAVQAVNTAKLALMGDGTHLVSLDQVIRTMRETGHDMMSKYKETAQGGLAVAVNQPAC